MTDTILPETVSPSRGSTPTGPITMPLTLAHYETLIHAGVFDQSPGKIELIEVSDSSAAFDRSETRDLYAEAMVKEYWLVDLAQRQIEVFREPASGKFQIQDIHKTSETISPLCLPEANLAILTLFGAAPLKP